MVDGMLWKYWNSKQISSFLLVKLNTTMIALKFQGDQWTPENTWINDDFAPWLISSEDCAWDHEPFPEAGCMNNQ